MEKLVILLVILAVTKLVDLLKTVGLGGGAGDPELPPRAPGVPERAAAGGSWSAGWEAGSAGGAVGCSGGWYCWSGCGSGAPWSRSAGESSSEAGWCRWR